MMKDDDFKLLRGFADRRDRLTDKQTDICDCRVAFATENIGFRKMAYPLTIQPFRGMQGDEWGFTEVKTKLGHVLDTWSQYKCAQHHKITLF